MVISYKLVTPYYLSVYVVGLEFLLGLHSSLLLLAFHVYLVLVGLPGEAENLEFLVVRLVSTHQLYNVFHQECGPSVIQEEVAKTVRLLVPSLLLEGDYDVFGLLVPAGQDVSGVVSPVHEQLQLVLQFVCTQLGTVGEEFLVEAFLDILDVYGSRVHQIITLHLLLLLELCDINYQAVLGEAVLQALHQHVPEGERNLVLDHPS